MKIKFGSLVTDGRGKIGGHVASKSRSGAYLRTKVTPVNPQTSYQMIARNRLATYSRLWRSLTAAQRAAWNGAVKSFQTTNVFGDLKNPSGLNLYVRLNANLSEINQPALTLPPLPDSTFGIEGVTAYAAVDTDLVGFEWTNGAIPGTTTYIVRVSRMISAGVSNANGRCVDWLLIESGQTSPFESYNGYEPVFGTMIAGAKLFLELVPVSVASGLKGTPIHVSTIVLQTI